jgi:hypothetical protein
MIQWPTAFRARNAGCDVRLARRHNLCAAPFKPSWLKRAKTTTDAFQD